MAILCDAKWNIFNLVDQDETDITASSENAFFPASNLKHPFSTKVFRSETGTATASIVFDFKTVENVNAILIRSDIANGWGFTGNLTIEANIADSWGTPAYSTTLGYDATFNVAAKYLDTAETYRYWRITATGTSYLELANIFIGEYFEAGKNISMPMKYEDRSLDKVSTNKFGQDFITENGTVRYISGDIKMLDKDEMKLLLDQFNYAGTSKPIWVTLDPLEQFSSDVELFSGQFRLTKKPVYDNIVYNYYNVAFALKEYK